MYGRKVAKKTWGESIPIVDQLIDTETDDSKRESVLIGVIYKEMDLKPSVLDEFKDANGIAITVAPVATNFCSEVTGCNMCVLTRSNFIFGRLE